MFINIDLQSEDPIYTQLKNQIIAGIAKKDLKLGEKLPSVRALAADIGINLHTVNKAYQQLKQEGFILIHRQKGVVIHPDGVPQADDAYREKLSRALNQVIAESVCRGIEREEFLQLCSRLYQDYDVSEEEN